MKRAAMWLVFGAISLVLAVKYLLAVQTSVAEEQRSACAALQAEPMLAEAPAFELPSLHGSKQSLAALRGQVVVLNFWATWCPPCVEEIPSLLALEQLTRGKGVALLTVSVDEDAEAVSSFFAKKRYPKDGLTVLLDPSKRVPASYGTTKFPETFLVDRQGMVRYKLIYKRDWASPTALACIRSLL